MKSLKMAVLPIALLAAFVSVASARSDTGTSGSQQPALTVHMRGSAFDPQSATITVGQTVLFVNDDEITHNVTADNFKSGDLQAGKGWRYKFDRAGTYKYVCTYHSWMKGEITANAFQ